MSDQVQFEEEVVLVDRASQLSRQSAFTGLMMRMGIAKTESQANYVLVGILAVSLIATIYVITRYLI